MTLIWALLFILAVLIFWCLNLLGMPGNWLIAGNQDSSTVAVFKIDQENGKLKPTGQVVNVPTPVCVTFVPVK